MKILYPISDVISVWIGTFASEADFNQCVDGPITKMLALNSPLASVCEVSFESSPFPIRKVLEGFSGWASFAEEVETVANQRNIHMANAALVCYYLKCEDAPQIWDKMHFLGSYKGSDVT